MSPAGRPRGKSIERDWTWFATIVRTPGKHGAWLSEWHGQWNGGEDAYDAWTSLKAAKHALLCEHPEIRFRKIIDTHWRGYLPPEEGDA